MCVVEYLFSIRLQMWSRILECKTKPIEAQNVRLKNGICEKRIKRGPCGFLIVDHKKGSTAVIIHAEEVEFQSAAEANDIQDAVCNLSFKLEEQAANSL